MSPKKWPKRLCHKQEIPYPKQLLAPSHGRGPRCKVDCDLRSGESWTTLQIMRIDDNNIDIEEYTCIMPRYYAIPLILINKHLAFYEAQCHPDGVPLRLADGSPSLKQRELREYTYLWKLRCNFLQSVYDMNHEQSWDESWTYEKIHGFLHRMYKRYGHNANQRSAYWKNERNEGRVPYTTPNIADMDWVDFMGVDIASNKHLNAFVWDRISQGYHRVVNIESPRKQWQAWRQRDRDPTSLLFRMPYSPVPELSVVSVPAAAAGPSNPCATATAIDG